MVRPTSFINAPKFRRRKGQTFAGPQKPNTWLATSLRVAKDSGNENTWLTKLPTHTVSSIKRMQHKELVSLFKILTISFHFAFSPVPGIKRFPLLQKIFITDKCSYQNTHILTLKSDGSDLKYEL